MADTISDTPKYTNFSKILHSADDFFLDFAILYPSVDGKPMENGKAHGAWVGRFVMSPSQAKLILKMLEENIRKYEETRGEIQLPVHPQNSPSGITLN